MKTLVFIGALMAFAVGCFAILTPPLWSAANPFTMVAVTTSSPSGTSSTAPVAPTSSPSTAVTATPTPSSTGPAR